MAVVTHQPTDNVVDLRAPLPDASPAAPDRRYAGELEVRAAAAATYAALNAATEHWAAHGGDLATHIRVALHSVRNIQAHAAADWIDSPSTQSGLEGPSSEPRRRRRNPQNEQS